MTGHRWQLRTTDLELSHGVLMGILNVTPDSFSDGGLYLDPDAAVEHGLVMVRQGAKVIDVGGASTRPGADSVSDRVEMERVIPVVQALCGEGVRVSIDTSRPAVAEAALDVGVEIVNDVRACRESGMAELVSEAGCGVVLMHMQGTSRDMHLRPTYDDVVEEVEEFLLTRKKHMEEAGVDPSRIAIDPGIGFGKTTRHNLLLIDGLASFARHGTVVLGASRKRFLGTLAKVDSPTDRDLPTAITTAVGFLNGARVFRVHDVASSEQALAISAAIVASQ